MMLTPEQLDELREKLERDYLCWRNPDVRRLFEHIDTQQARITELEGAIGSALGGPYYMDPPDGGGVTLEDQLQRMAKDAARYRSICRDVAKEWGNFAGGADECLRRIEAYEQSKETP